MFNFRIFLALNYLTDVDLVSSRIEDSWLDSRDKNFLLGERLQSSSWKPYVNLRESSLAGKRPESSTTADIFRLRESLRTLFSPPSKAEILGSAPSSRFPKWSIVFGCLSCFSRRVGRVARSTREIAYFTASENLSVIVEHFGLELRLPELETTLNKITIFYFSRCHARVFFKKCGSFATQFPIK